MAGRILVGVDGSEGSRQALAWAVEEAVARGAVVEAVIVWQGPYAFGEELAYPLDEAETAALARERLTTVIAGVAGDHPPVQIEPIVAEGDPAEILCSRAQDADLLVVGARRHGAVAGSLLGSVSSTCAHRCPRPVVILPR